MATGQIYNQYTKCVQPSGYTGLYLGGGTIPGRRHRDHSPSFRRPRRGDVCGDPDRHRLLPLVAVRASGLPRPAQCLHGRARAADRHSGGSSRNR